MERDQGNFGFLCLLCLFVAISLTGLTYAQQNRNAAGSDIKLLPVSGNVYMLVGAGANVTMSVGRDGILLVDTGNAPMADKLLAAGNQCHDQFTASTATASLCHQYER